VRVAVDAMGGDHAPRELVAGSLDAAHADPSLAIVLVGRHDAIHKEIDVLGGAPGNIDVVHADDVIGMHESPVDAIRRRPEASILKAMHLMRDGNADAVIAAGSTGASVAAAMMALHRLPGVRRPAIAVPLPARNRHGVCLLLDAGANPNCRPHHLRQYAIMGANFYRELFEDADPRVGLVSIGAEAWKGNALTRDATRLLEDAPVRFVGNVEDVFGDECEVAVADGFVGNTILKTTEGCAHFMLDMLRDVMAKDALEAATRRIDAAELGGAPLLGMDGTVMICHGRSDRRAVRNAIRAGARSVKQHVNENIVRGLRPEHAGTGA